MKLLIVRVGAMGDVLHALPGVAALRLARPDWRIDWAIDRRWALLLKVGDEAAPVVNNIHLVEAKEWVQAPASIATLRSIYLLRKALRRERYDAVVDMQGTLRSAVIGRIAGAREFAGYSDPREAIAASFYKQKVMRRGTHVVRQGANLLSDVFNPGLEPAAFELPREDWADNWAEELVGEKKVCLISPGGGWGAKRWPMEKFGLLAVELNAAGFAVIVNSPRKEDPTAQGLVVASGGAAKVAVCNVSGLIALMRRTTLMIGGDSGPTHMAAALGVPLVALFGPTSPERNGPWGAGPMRVLRDSSSVTSYKKSAEVDPGLAKLSVDDVLRAVRELI